MDPARYRRIKDAFERTYALTGPEREAELARLCGGDATVRAEVQALLAEHDRGDGDGFDALLEEPGPRALGDLAAAHELPERIAGFRILRVAGRGGAGIVYEAEQDAPRRRVALKVIEPGPLTDGGRSKQLLKRFHLETQVLARLDHVGIARVFEAGTFDGMDGRGPRPWFAMEFVSGRTLVEHADAEGLDVRARLELIVHVCDAVQHAHEQGVIHRDLKPANVIVTESGQPKVLDFGVARVTDSDFQVTTLQTQIGQLVGTVPYMSPEQAAGDSARIDARSDVYALGVLAYELVAGRLPLELRGCSISEALRRIENEDPARLGTIDRSLRGDVETIVGKALAKEPERRYDSAAGLAADLRRFLRHDPIQARPASASYQLTRFARRNRALVVGVGGGLAIAFVALVVALLFSLEKTRDAEASAAFAEREAGRASVAAAAASIELGAFGSAQDRLARVPIEQRAWEWRYLQARLDTSERLFTFDAPLATAGFTRDGASLVAVVESGAIQRFDAATGALLGEVRLDGDLPGAPDERLWHQPVAVLDTGADHLAVRAGTVVRIHDARTGARLAAVDLGAELAAEYESRSVGTRRGAIEGTGLNAIDLAPDGAFVAIGTETGGYLWRWRDGRAGLERLVEGPVQRVDVADDGRIALHAFDERSGVTQVFDSATGVYLFDIEESARTTDMELLGGGETLLVADFWKPLRSSGAMEVFLYGHELHTLCLDWNAATGRLASAGEDRQVLVWDIENGSRVAGLHGHLETVSHVAFDEGGSRLLAAAGRALRVWSMADAVAAPGSDGRVRTTVFGSERIGLPTYGYGVGFAPDGGLVSLDWSGRLVRRASDGSVVAERALGRNPARLAIGDGGRVVAASVWGRAVVLDEDLNERAFVGQSAYVTDLDLDREGARLAVRMSGRVLVVALEDSDGERASAGATSGNAEVRGAAALRGTAPFDGLELDGAAPLFERRFDDEGGPDHVERRRAVALSLDGTRVAFEDGARAVVVADVASGDELARFELTALASSLRFDPSGDRLACGEARGTLRVWNLRSGQPLLEANAHSAAVYALAFTPDGERLASGSVDTTIRLWDVRDGAQVALFTEHLDYVHDLRFSPDGERLASASGDRTLRVWDTRPRHRR